MWLDGVRSATRKEQEGGTCATRVTRETFDFQEEDSLELRAENFTSNFQSSFRRGALKAAFKHLSDRSIHKKKRLARDGGI